MKRILYRGLTLDADTGGRRSYTPDHLIINRRTGIAHMVDVKRSLTSYEASRIAELKKSDAGVRPRRAGSCLQRGTTGSVVKEVRVVILNAQGGRTDIKGGIWPLTHLDHVLEVTGAGESPLCRLRKLFRERIDANWEAARGLGAATVPKGSSSKNLDDPSYDAGDEGDPAARRPDAGDESAAVPKDLPPVIVGFCPGSGRRSALALKALPLANPTH